MSTFETFQQQWQEYCSTDPVFIQILERKLMPLLNHNTIEYAKQGIALLRELESCSLVLILEQRDNAFIIADPFSDSPRRIEQCVVEEVSKKDSDWFPLYEEGLFDGMLLRSMGLNDWNELSNDIQQRLLNESKRMERITAGEFLMGALPTDQDAFPNEHPRHKVILSRSFYLGKYPIAQGLWNTIMDNNPSHFIGSTLPVEQVSWFQCIEFCNRLSLKDELNPAYTINGQNVQCDFDSEGYRLPTEAEWEFAARGGQYHLHSGSDSAELVAWYKDNSNSSSHGIGQKKPNDFDLYDMSGNILDWCWDLYDEDYYAQSPTQNPTGAVTGTDRVNRGGGWYGTAQYSRISRRRGDSPSSQDNVQGFRICRTIVPTH